MDNFCSQTNHVCASPITPERQTPPESILSDGPEMKANRISVRTFRRAGRRPASGVTTCVCVPTAVRGGVEHNYRMIVVKDATAEVSRDTHEAELRTMKRVFADAETTDEVKAMLSGPPW
jgi:hypothetical protein